MLVACQIPRDEALVRVRSEGAFFPLRSAMILIHDLGSHWRIREPFSGHRVLIPASWCTMSFLPHRHAWRQTRQAYWVLHVYALRLL
jgi:hypothetical protein